MLWSLCGVPGLDSAGSAHIRTGLENQKLEQVRIASLTTPLETRSSRDFSRVFRMSVTADLLVPYNGLKSQWYFNLYHSRACHSVILLQSKRLCLETKEISSLGQ